MSERRSRRSEPTTVGLRRRATTIAPANGVARERCGTGSPPFRCTAVGGSAGAVAYIRKIVFDPSGAVIGDEELPYLFDDVGEARHFLGVYVSAIFESGRCGYDRADGSWWACDDTKTVALQRYTVGSS